MASCIYLNDYCRNNTLIETYPNNAMLLKESPKRYPYSPIQPKTIPLSQICSDLSLTPKKAPFSENFRTRMLTHIGKVVPRAWSALSSQRTIHLGYFTIGDHSDTGPLGLWPALMALNSIVCVGGSWYALLTRCRGPKGTNRASHMLSAMVYETPWWSPYIN